MPVIKVLPLAALVALSLVPAPAAAKTDRALSRELSNPGTQHAIGDMLGALLGVMLQMPAEPLARAAEAAGDHETARSIPNGATIGDLAGPEARQLAREVRRRAPAMIGALGGLAGAMEDMAPELERIGKDFERTMDNAAR
jgi:hypothetical protein